MWEFILGFVVASALWGTGVLSWPIIKGWYEKMRS